MLNKKSFYSILAIVLVAVIFGYDYYLNYSESQKFINEGALLKNQTNAYFLPNSTDNQIVHHVGYSLSYSEEHEQSEWVAYELKKSQYPMLISKDPILKLIRQSKQGRLIGTTIKTRDMTAVIYARRPTESILNLLMMILFL